MAVRALQTSAQLRKQQRQQRRGQVGVQLDPPHQQALRLHHHQPAAQAAVGKATAQGVWLLLPVQLVRSPAKGGLARGGVGRRGVSQGKGGTKQAQG